MKKHHLFMAALAMGLFSCGPVYVVHQDPPPQPPPPAAAPEAPADLTYQQFYDDLSPYGQWIDNPTYGYVWLPDAGPDFKPYATNGQWVLTDEGWTWSSGYPWGWATFHYGRWFFEDGYGWMWIPGNEWAPAWVSWRNSDDYYGWAPLGPEVTMSIAIGGGYNPPPHYWNFVPHQYVASPQVANYYVRESNNVTIINRTTIINTTVNNTTIINNNGPRRYGPDPNEVGRFSGAPVRPVPIRNGNGPGASQNANGAFTVFRPHINAPGNQNRGNFNNSPRPAPAHFQPLSGARPVNRNTYGNNNGGNNNRPPVNTGFPNNGGTPNRPQQGNSPAGNQPNNNGGQQQGNQWNRPGGQQTGSQPANNNQPASNQQSGSQNPFNRPGNQPANNQPANNQPNNNGGQQNGNQPANNQNNNGQFQRRSNPMIRSGQQQNNQPSGNQQPANQPNNQRQGGQQQTQGTPNRNNGQPNNGRQNTPAANQRQTQVQRPVQKPTPPARKPDDKKD